MTLADVAREAGVSRALVSIVMRGVPGASPQNREHVLRVAAELDYQPDQRARLLGSGRSRTLGVVFGLREPFHGDLVEALYSAVSATDWRLSLQPRMERRPEAVAVRELLAERVEAVVLVGSLMDRGALSELAERVPVVLLARSLPPDGQVQGVGTVRTDDEAGIELALHHLLDLGHRHIAYVHGQRAPGAAERRRAYRKVLTAAGLPVDLVAGGTTSTSGEKAAVALTERCGAERPTAVLAFNDVCAAGLLASLRAHDVTVPDKLSVVGFDDSAIASLETVSLTTVGQDVHLLAAEAVAQATQRVEQEINPANAVIAPQLIVRRTTSAPPL
ncbi:LacI family DNA-binding transcriptional regulator [Kineococcus esterisolvens]|uniref:LacI family DNA-binding transcriptional regulator n=1 Tax=unclassified Kineococcus TaxID=2621656 RepID=UPI003D7C96FF